MPKTFAWRDQLTVPNLLTLMRLLMIPVMAYFIYHIERYPRWGLALFLAIWCTDFLDGYIARHFNQISDLGKLFDPAVDKLFQFTTALMLFWVGRMPLWVPVFILCKELLMVFGSLILLRQNFVVSASYMGKISTLLWVLSFAVMLVLPPQLLHWANLIFLLPALMALVAFVSYLCAYLRKTHERD